MANGKRSPLLSVIVPIYNVDQYVPKCIESIINQTYHNLEIILVDDGSTDRSGLICDRYADIDRRIHVIHKKNGGLSDARNCGLDYASGEVIGFVDGDDWIHSQMYEIMINQLINNDASIVTCNFQQNNMEQFMKPIACNTVKTRLMTGTEGIIDIEIPLVIACNKIYKCELFNNLQYPVGRLHEDEFVVHKIFHKCDRMVVVDKPLYFYSIREGSIVSKLTEKHIEDALSALMDRIEFAEKEKWNEVLPAVVKRYCDYCIDRYFEIEERKHAIPISVANLLWKQVANVIKKYPDIDIGKQYYIFAQSPKAYKEYMKCHTRKKAVWDVIMYIPRKLNNFLKAYRDEVGNAKF